MSRRDIGMIFDRDHLAEAKRYAAEVPPDEARELQRWLASSAPYLYIYTLPVGPNTAVYYRTAESWADAVDAVLEAITEQASEGCNAQWFFALDDRRRDQLKVAMDEAYADA